MKRFLGRDRQIKDTSRGACGRGPLFLFRGVHSQLPRHNGRNGFRSMKYEQEVIFKCAIKGTIGGLQEKLTAEDFDELLNASQDWREHLVIESITEVATIHAGRRRPEID